MYDKAQLEQKIRGLGGSPKERDPRVIARAREQIQAVVVHMARSAGVSEESIAKLPDWAREIASVRQDRSIALKGYLRELQDADEKTIREAFGKAKKTDLEDAVRHYIARRLEEDGVNRGSDKHKAEFYSRMSVIAETADAAAGYACAVAECALRTGAAKTVAKNIDHVLSKLMGVVETSTHAVELADAKKAAKPEAKVEKNAKADETAKAGK